MSEGEITSWHWRNSMKPVRFFNFDGRLGFFVLGFILHIRLSSIFMLGAIFAGFYLLERQGLSFPAAIRAIRLWFIGPVRPGYIYTRRRKLLDTGSS